MNNDPKAYTYDPSLEPFEQEVRLIEHFVAVCGDNKKKIVQHALKLRNAHPRHMQISFFDVVALTRDPAKWMKRTYDEMRIIPELMKELRDDGNHGMIYDGDRLFGFNLICSPNWLRPSDRWNEHQECQIIDQALLLWMCVQRRRQFKGRIVLFREFGFSGVPFEAQHRYSDKHWEQLQDIWKKEDAHIMSVQLKKYMKLAMERDPQ